MQASQLLRASLAATALATIMAAPAHAAVIVNTTSLSIPATADGLYINLVTGANASTPVAGWDINPYVAGTAVGFFFGGATSPNNGGVANTGLTGYLDLPLGAVVSAASTFSQNAQSTFATAFATPGTHFLGMRFQNEQTGAVNYGYLQFSVGAGSTNGFPLTLVGWAYENNGTGITVAAIPEPGTYALMLAGLAGVAGIAARRRKAN